ncbi:reticulon-1-B-like isoform X2 [Anneissia japonica]|uniref:reticulon-1-B-like isoform X2 n=1 Tax=Anneissia japonica TaxID=1529436 RepID=UPI00142585BB|nr:reticulon-1-B-like isoform X2 [Anneissia japonica]
MEEFQHYKFEAEANQQQDLLSDDFVRVDNPADSADMQPKPSDTAEEDLYSATPSDEPPAAYSSDLVSFDSSPTTDSSSRPFEETISAPADSSSDPQPQFTETSHQDDAPVEDLLGGFGSSGEPVEPVVPPQEEEPEVEDIPVPASNSNDVAFPTPLPVVEESLTQPEEEPEPAVVEEVSPAPSIPRPSPALISSSPSEGALIDLSRLDPRVVDLVYWRDPKKSGVAFASILIVLLAFANFSSISVVAYLLLSILTVTISFRVYKSVLQAVQKTGDGNPFKPYLESDITLCKDDVSNYAGQAVDKINCYADSLRRLILVEDLVESIKFAVFLWFLTYIGCMFNGLTLVILAHIALFSLPLVYEMNKAQIDDVLGKAYAKVNAFHEQLKEKVPFLKKKKTE